MYCLFFVDISRVSVKKWLVFLAPQSIYVCRHNPEKSTSSSHVPLFVFPHFCSFPTVFSPFFPIFFLLHPNGRATRKQQTAAKKLKGGIWTTILAKKPKGPAFNPLDPWTELTKWNSNVPPNWLTHKGGSYSLFLWQIMLHSNVNI